MNKPEREIIAVVCVHPHEEEGLGPRDRETYERAGKVFRELCAQGVHPVVVVGHATGIILPEAERIALIERIRSYLSEHKLIPEEYSLHASVDHPGENAEKIAWRTNLRLKANCGHEIKVHVLMFS